MQVLDMEKDIGLVEHKKDILVSLLKHEAEEIERLIFKIESDKMLNKKSVKDFFDKKTKVENRILRHMFKD